MKNNLRIVIASGAKQSLKRLLKDTCTCVWCKCCFVGKERLLAITFGLLLLVLLLAACAGTPTAPPSAALTQVNVVMGYIPHVQFAPWFVADKKGYFAAAGIKVKYNWGFETDGLKLLGVNQTDFAMLGGDQVIQARAQGIPLVYVASYYHAFPISVFSLKEKNIQTPKDLVGKKVGLPGYFGATYTGWRALLHESKIKEDDVQTQVIGFTQVAAVTQGLVDAAAGYSNNEPVQLKLAGKEINVIKVSDYSTLVGIGLVTNEKMIAEKPLVVQNVVRALVRGMQDTVSQPNQAIDATLVILPEAGGSNLKTTQAVLDATLELWKSQRVGFTDPAAWESSYKFMKDAGFIKSEFNVSSAYTNRFVP